MTLTLILDTSAIVAYTRQDTHTIGVSETLHEVADNGDRFGLPVLCLAEATNQADGAQSALLDVLAAHPAAEVIADDLDWRDLGFSAHLYDSYSRAVAYLTAMGCGAYLLTAEPGVYGGPDTDGIIGV